MVPEHRFPDGGRYYPMSIHEHPRRSEGTQATGMTKGVELAVGRRQGRALKVQPGCKARQMPKAEFQREVEKELTGKDSEP